MSATLLQVTIQCMGTQNSVALTHRTALVIFSKNVDSLNKYGLD